MPIKDFNDEQPVVEEPTVEVVDDITPEAPAEPDAPQTVTIRPKEGAELDYPVIVSVPGFDDITLDGPGASVTVDREFGEHLTFSTVAEVV